MSPDHNESETEDTDNNNDSACYYNPVFKHDNHLCYGFLLAMFTVTLTRLPFISNVYGPPLYIGMN